MKFVSSLCLIILLYSFTNVSRSNDVRIQPANIRMYTDNTDTIPAIMRGNFKDDYGIEYTLTDSLFTQHPNVKYHILRWNLKEQYFIAKNDETNPSEQGLYSRIDYMEFTNMEPFKWGFCLTSYNASSAVIAEATAAADRKNPKKGCGGFPFSRMKRVD